MKKNGILNVQLIGLIASLGHGETFLIGDAGMPIPDNVEIVDLALGKDIPKFKDVLDFVLLETEVEHFVYANELTEKHGSNLKYMLDKLSGVSSEKVSHEDLKKLSSKCKFAIRTGEFTPYSNVILSSGVVF